MDTSTVKEPYSRESLTAANIPLGPAAVDLVTTGVADLVPGRALRFPIHDAGGLLLLAEGTTLTTEFKRALDARDIKEVQLHPEDFERLTFRGSHDDTAQNLQLDDALVKKLDSVVNAGLLFVVNSASALLDQIVHRGCKDYDQQHYLDRINRNKEASVFIDNLMRDALRGESIDCGDVVRLTASYLNDITNDIDCTLSAKLDTLCQNPISDHCVAMAVLGMALGVELGLDARNVRMIALAGLLHDWGMIRVPEEIRDATRRLSEEESFEIAKHPLYTLRLLEQICGVQAPVPLICYQVHERPNGGGYPQGRTSARIHLMAKILAVADAYNALISPRPYRPPLTPYAAMECILRQSAAGDFDPQVARALLMVQSLFPIGSYVILADGRAARVLRRNGDKFTQPNVKIVQDQEGTPLPDDAEGTIIDLSAAGLDVVKTLPSPGTHAIGLSPEILGVGRRSLCGPDAPRDRKCPTSVAEIMDMVSMARSRTRPHGSPAEVLSWDGYSEKQKRLALWALDVLDGASQMGERQYSNQRSNSRTKLRTVITVCLINSKTAILDHRSGCVFRALTNDVSRGGISWIHPGELRTDDVLIGLPDSREENKWFLGKIRRRREMGDTGFWEHGVALRQRVHV